MSSHNSPFSLFPLLHSHSHSLFIILLLPIFLLFSCTARPPPAPLDARVLSDGLGRQVALRVPSRRIISIAPSNTEILFAVGAGPQIVACDDYSSYPAEAGALRRIGSGSNLDLEGIVAMEPDVVLAAEIHSTQQVRSLERVGVTVFYVSNPTTFPGLFENMRLLGLLAGREEQARRLVEGLEARVAAVATRLRGAATRPRVFYELDATDSTQPWTAGPGTFLHTLLTLAGGRNFAEDQPQGFPRVSAESIVRSEPDVIILGDAVFGVTPESIAKRAGWGSLQAVRQGKVHPFDHDLASRPGPRLVDGLETLARLLHPEAFDG